MLYEPSPLLAACVCASCVGSATVHVICRKAVPWVPRWPFVVRACALHHLRRTCAAWYYKYRCMLFLQPASRESGTLVITESFGLRHQEEPCACGEPRVSHDYIWRPTWVVICPSVGFFFRSEGERCRFAIIFRKSLFIFSACYLCCCVVFSPVRALCLSCA